MKRKQFTRRGVFDGVEQILTGEPPGRIAPRRDLVNVLEFENVAERKLNAEAYAAIKGTSHGPFERITFQPKLMVNTLGLDLSGELFGQKTFSPIIAGPVAQQKMFHPEGELATVRGASAAKTTMVVSCRSTCDIELIAAEAKSTLWYQAYPEVDVNAVRAGIQKAVENSCKAVVLTVGTPQSRALNWSIIDQLRQGLTVPFLLKSIMSAEEAQQAVQKGVQGIIVSNYGGLLTTGEASAIEMLPIVVDAVGSKVPVLVDGSFRRGTDILKALAFGAKAVLLGRPLMWGLAAYGGDGVQNVLEMLQTELGRNMAMCGRPDLKSIDRTVVKVHGLPPQSRV